MTGNIRKFGSMTVRTIKPKQKELDKYYKLFAPKDSIKEAIRKYQVMDDLVPYCNKVIEIMCRHNARAKALFEGSNTSGDPSKDDFALLVFLNSFTHGNAEMMKEIFLRSALRGEKNSDFEIRKWNDHMTNILGVEIEREFGIKYSKSRMEDAITFVTHKRTINLPAMYMKSLTYVGKEHISKLLSKYLGAEKTELNSWIMKHILVGMVKRVFHPSCKFDELMVLTGSQGVGKTSFI
ncbi:hypothetical protein HMPREF9630_00520 [Peptoanaerobacter stomatis]|uniref:Virulence-associated protein E-like domain-containing protein n=1 Tax=Peptoanaerobacter stomatis TaxID=796937 RepID=V9HPW9_9FIRM|nr:hypothetical protein HMPREF9630_00520 [Peptoanaerobacter stomatis]